MRNKYNYFREFEEISQYYRLKGVNGGSDPGSEQVNGMNSSLERDIDRNNGSYELSSQLRDEEEKFVLENSMEEQNNCLTEFGGVDKDEIEDGEEEEEGDCCVICLDSLANKTNMREYLAKHPKYRPRILVKNEDDLMQYDEAHFMETPCSHQFHTSCLLTWMK